MPLVLALSACDADAPSAPQASEPSAAASEAEESATVASAADQQSLTLRLPEAEVDHVVRPEGLAQGDIINPAQGSLIWFTGADRVFPGDRGTAVVAGHVSYEGRPDIFASLVDVEPGAPLETVNTDGSTQRWAVTAVEVLDKGAVQRDARVWDAQRRTRRLVLITCDDAYGFRDDGHRKTNLIVIAEPVIGQG